MQCSASDHHPMAGLIVGGCGRWSHKSTAGSSFLLYVLWKRTCPASVQFESSTRLVPVSTRRGLLAGTCRTLSTRKAAVEGPIMVQDVGLLSVCVAMLLVE